MTFKRCRTAPLGGVPAEGVGEWRDACVAGGVSRDDDPGGQDAQSAPSWHTRHAHFVPLLTGSDPLVEMAYP